MHIIIFFNTLALVIFNQNNSLPLGSLLLSDDVFTDMRVGQLVTYMTSPQ